MCTLANVSWKTVKRMLYLCTLIGYTLKISRTLNIPSNWVMANLPRLPIRPVRPIRWTYSSMSDGRSKLMTCLTCGMSKPRAATCRKIWKSKNLKNNTYYILNFTILIFTHTHTKKKSNNLLKSGSIYTWSKKKWPSFTAFIILLTAVATRMGHWPERKTRRASSRSRWLRSPWMLVTGYPWRYKNSSRASAPFLVSTNTNVRDSVGNGDMSALFLLRCWQNQGYTQRTDSSREAASG